MMTHLPEKIEFADTSLAIVDHLGRPWLRGVEIADAFGYVSPRQRIDQLFRQHCDEFTDEMTAVVTLPTAGGSQRTRIFSPRGAHLLAMFARTPQAKKFRRFVLDVLEKLDTGAPAPSVAEPPQPTLFSLDEENRKAELQAARDRAQDAFTSLRLALGGMEHSRASLEALPRIMRGIRHMAGRMKQGPRGVADDALVLEVLIDSANLNLHLLTSSHGATRLALTMAVEREDRRSLAAPPAAPGPAPDTGTAARDSVKGRRKG